MCKITKYNWITWTINISRTYRQNFHVTHRLCDKRGSSERAGCKDKNKWLVKCSLLQRRNWYGMTSVSTLIMSGSDRGKWERLRPFKAGVNMKVHFNPCLRQTDSHLYLKVFLNFSSLQRAYKASLPSMGALTMSPNTENTKIGYIQT